jgi:hypothetical protein
MWLAVDPVFLYRISKAVAEEKDKPDKVMKKLVKAFKPYFEPFED